MKFREKNIDVKIIIEDELPPVMADGEKLGQAFINILINAIESSDPFGKIFVRFRKIRRQNREYAAVIFGDEGKGVDEKDKMEIFKPFFTKKTKGVGLGLANVKRIIEAHNGFVTAERKTLKGALFSIMIPMGNT